MEQMGKKNCECCNCHYYRAYYFKGYTRFERQMHGYCINRQREVSNHESCTSWCRNQMRRNIRKKVLVRALNDMISDIAEISQILCEDREESQSDRE